MHSSRLSSYQPKAGQASRPLGREGLESSLLGMPNICGLAVYYYRHACVQLSAFTHRLRSDVSAWVQSYGLVRTLYHLCTQVLPIQNMVFPSVNLRLYPLSTQPIKATTLKNLSINYLITRKLINHQTVNSMKGSLVI